MEPTRENCQGLTLKNIEGRTYDICNIQLDKEGKALPCDARITTLIAGQEVYLCSHYPLSKKDSPIREAQPRGSEDWKLIEY